MPPRPEAPGSSQPPSPSAARSPWRTGPVGRSLPPPLLYVLVDVAAVAVAAVVAHLLRFGTSEALLPGPDISYTLIALASVPTWLAVVALAGAYDRRVLGVGSEEYRRVLDGGVHFLAVIAVLHFAFNLVFARGWVGVMIPVAVVLTVLARYGLRRWLFRQRARGRYLHRMLLVGSPSTVIDVGVHLQRTSWSGFRVVGACVDAEHDGALDLRESSGQGDGSHSVSSNGGGDGVDRRGNGDGPHGAAPRTLEIGGEAVPIMGSTRDVASAITACRADSVAVTDDSVAGGLGELARTVAGDDGPTSLLGSIGSSTGPAGGRGGVELLVAPAITDVAGPRTVIRSVAGLPLLHVEDPTFAGPQRLLKESIDRLCAALGLLLLTPLFLLVALLIRLNTPGPIFFRQVRVGRDGQRFQIVKFRTMVANAEQMRVELAERDEGNGVLFKLHRDPRITQVGRVLRRWSIDELPQLWNVLRGQMSLVGPRPPLPGEVERYERAVNRRLLVKPGMTGLWQVSGRSDLQWDEAVRLDLYYVDHWSPIMDAAIIVRTFSAVIRGDGAY